MITKKILNLVTQTTSYWREVFFFEFQKKYSWEGESQPRQSRVRDGGVQIRRAAACGRLPSSASRQQAAALPEPGSSEP